MASFIFTVNRSKIDSNLKRVAFEREIKISVPHEALVLGYRPNTCRNIENRIKRGMVTIAFLISEGYKEYIPLFKRLEDELERHQMERSAIKRALELSQQHPKL